MAKLLLLRNNKNKQLQQPPKELVEAPELLSLFRIVFVIVTRTIDCCLFVAVVAAVAAVAAAVVAAVVETV